MNIKVLIVDDHEMVRRGLALFLDLAPDLELVAEAGNGAEAIRLARQYRPNVVLMDLLMPEVDGVEATRQIRQLLPETKVLALTSFAGEDIVLKSLQAGATGYLLKDIDATRLLDAIRATHAGQSTLAPHAARAVLAVTAPSKPRPRYSQLTDRERDVLRLMVRGLTNSQIARSLIVTRATVNYHVSSILSKLEARTRTGAVAVALNNQLVA